MIGAGEDVDFDIPHISLIDKSFIVSGMKTGRKIQSFIGAAGENNKLIIDGVPRVGNVPLQHLDVIKLGAFEYRYEEPLPLQQAVLYYLSNEVRQGWLLGWDVSADAFPFLTREEGREPVELNVQFCELKAVAFLRDFDGIVTKNLLSLKAPRKGHLVRLLFADGEEMTGYILNWKNPGERFYFFPDSLGNNILFLLVERHTLKEIQLIKHDDAAVAGARKEFERILQEFKAAFQPESRALKR